MQSMNRVTLIGTVSKLPEKGYLANKIEASIFILKTCESYKAKDGNWKTLDSFHRIVCFNKEHIKALTEKAKMNTEIFVEGKLKTRKYKDKNGEEKYITEIVIDMYDGVCKILNGGLANSQDEFDDGLPFC